MNSVRTIRLLVLVLDVFLAIVIGIFASKTFPGIPNSVLVALLIVLFFIRIGLDWISITSEEKFYQEKFYQDFIQEKLSEMQRDKRILELIHEKMEKALSEGNLKDYEMYLKLKKEQ